MDVFARVPSDSLVVLLYRSSFKIGSYSTSPLHTGRHEVLFEIHN